MSEHVSSSLRMILVLYLGYLAVAVGYLRKVLPPRIMDRYIGVHGKENRSIKVAREVLERPCDWSMSLDEEDSFRVSFMVYVMSTLLAPGVKYDYAALDYWNALDVPSLIRTYYWADYVMERLIDAVVKLQFDMKSVNVRFFYRYIV
ncbi:hypothetical protein GQ55_4G270300 [Panicum hallii var. hallii]|uniref:Uncharacterized protein n=1 Tax=Panicum hallii var. hallii TaxID=1504633 RepID=A0A2T7E0M9_9POAL|nr:hypothetical protein GQ55_4G270300 [Panicum hallii var. hallii]